MYVRFICSLCICLGVVSMTHHGNAQSGDMFSREREEMVQSQIIRRGVTDTAVLRALRAVPRHRFVPADEVKFAYEDYPLPIGFNQTISQPYIVALMTALLHVQKGDRVCEVGTGSGYQAAVLAEMGCTVSTIEIIPELAYRAERLLKQLGYTNVQVKAGDGYQGWKEQAPFDAIIITAAAEHIPSPLVEQLKEGGRMILPVDVLGGYQMLKVIRKKNDSSIHEEDVIPVRFVPLVRDAHP